ncbi:MAG TPA: hypothetical protein VJ859_13045 [Allosphingosinicella sp.]|nr:hypothetical protein [Allosphingosinicella sp.]
MRYFLDTEFNSFGGALISIALAPEFGDREYYAVLEMSDALHPWVERHVMPYLYSVPPGMVTAPMPSETVARELAHYLADDDDVVIVADWPEDIAHFCSLIVTGPTELARIGNLRFEFINSPGFSTAENSRVPHNALHDARALRAFILSEPALP